MNMEPDFLAQKIGQWLQKYKGEEPFSFGEVHLLTGEEKADILLIIGKIASETTDRRAYERQWENTTYDHPVTWLWQQLADEEADVWLRLMYETEWLAKKKQMLLALLELATLIENNGYKINWEAEEEGQYLTEITINKIAEKCSDETQRWQALILKTSERKRLNNHTSS